MNDRAMFLLMLFTVLALVMVACGGGAEGKPVSGTGKAVFAVSDDAADLGTVSKIELTVNAVQVHAKGGAWTTVSNEARTFDLVELRTKGTAQLLAQTDLQASAYDQLRFDISKVIVTDTSGRHEAKLPSNTLQIKGDLDVKANATATATFDFLADQSLHVTGEGRYILAPVIHLETKSNATAEVLPNNEVKITGGSTTTDSQVGMDVEGSMDLGLRITPDAILTVAASGKILQTKGQALAVGTVKTVDTANGTVTITTKAGTDLVLHLASGSDVRVKGSKSSLAALAGNIGAQVISEYNAETKAATDLHANADAKAQAEVGAKINITGTIKAVDALAGTVTVTADSGADVVLKIGPDAKVQLDGTTSNLPGLGAKIGSRMQGEFDAAARTTSQIQAQAEANVTASGVIKEVDVAEGTVTITRAGSDLTLEVAPSTKLLVNGSLATLATLKALIGSDLTAAYSRQTKVISELNAQAKAEQSAVVTGAIKAVDVLNHTITIATQPGEYIVVNAEAQTRLHLNGSVTTLVALAANLDAQVKVEYNPQTRAALLISALAAGGVPPAVRDPSKDASVRPAPEARPTLTPASRTAKISGTLKAVNVLAGTVTIAVQGQADLVLNMTTESKNLLNAQASTLANLVTAIGGRVNAEYRIEARTVITLDVQR